MSASFSNTENVGFAVAATTVSDTSGPSVTLPSDSADGVFHLAIMGEDGDAGAGDNLTVSAVSEAHDLVGLASGVSCILAISSWEQSGEPPATVDLLMSGAAPIEQEVAFILAITDHDATTPVKEIVTNTGEGTAISYPASTEIATADDLVLRVVVCDSASPIRALSGSPGTLVKNYTGGQFGVCMMLSRAAGAGSTVAADASSTTIDASDFWVAATIIIAGSGAAGAATPSSAGVDDLDVLYDNELRVEIDGSGFGATQGAGIVQLQDAASSPATEVAQTVLSWSDTQIVFNVDLGALTAGANFLAVTPDGGSEGTLAVTVNADPGAGAVARRSATMSGQMTLGDVFSLDVGVRFFAVDVQDELTLMVDGLPAGLAFDGESISGTVALGAAAGSPYNVTVDCDDLDGNSAAQDAFTLTISTASPVVLPLSRVTRFLTQRMTGNYGGF